MTSGGGPDAESGEAEEEVLHSNLDLQKWDL